MTPAPCMEIVARFDNGGGMIGGTDLSKPGTRSRTRTLKVESGIVGFR